MGIDQGAAQEAGRKLLDSPMRYVTGLRKFSEKNKLRFGASLFIIFAFMLIALEAGS